MPGRRVPKRRGMRRDQLGLADDMRRMGAPWRDIAVVFRERYGCNGLSAMRLAHCWSQRDAAERWNRRWPHDSKTYKNFSYWETWPRATGFAPSLTVLGQLATLYECAVSDLVADLTDACSDDMNSSNSAAMERLIRKPLAAALNPAFGQLVDTSIDEISAAGMLWADQLSASNDAHALLGKLAVGLALAASQTTGRANDTPVEPGWPDMVGTWHSQRATGDHIEAEHHVVVTERRGWLMAKSLPHPAGSMLRMRLVRSGPSLIGTWEQRDADGQASYGTVRLTAPDDTRRIAGQWLSLGSGPVPTGGEWVLTWRGGILSGSELIAFHAAQPPTNSEQD